MASHQIILFLHITFIVLTGKTNAQNPDVGKVFIGTYDPATGQPEPQDFTFKENTVQSLPIYALVYGEGNPSSLVPKTEDFTLSCDIAGAGPGASVVDIQDVTIPAALNATGISLNARTSGRSVYVTCYGQSLSAACPVSVGGAQFCPLTSESNSVSVTVTPPPTVSICEREVSVKNDLARPTEQFSVRLTETAVADVSVTCTLVPGATPLSLQFNQLTISAGEITGQVSFTVQSGVGGSEASVTCVANSLTGNQFSPQDRTDTSTARFVMRSNSVSFSPAWSQIYNTAFVSFFSLSEPVTSGSVIVSCQATVVSSMTDAETLVNSPDCSFTTGASTPTTTTTTTTPAPTTTTPPPTTGANDTNTTTPAATTSAPLPTTPPDPTSPWVVLNSTFEIKLPTSQSLANPSQTLFHNLTTQRLREVIDVRTEVIITTCCVLPSSTNQNFQGMSAVAVAVADLAPFVCARCTNESITNPRNERTVQNPGYVELAPCPCDLTDNKCDINCCCDGDCSTNEQARFSGCIPGLPGGQSAEPEEYRCSSKVFNRPDWHLMTCVYWENNAYLGMFYMNRQKLANINEINTEVYKKYKERFSIGETERRFEDEDSLLQDYQYGTIVRTVQEGRQATGTDTLAMSRPGPGLSCNPLSPVRFLIDTESSCRTVVSQSLCEDPVSVLSSRIYAIHSSVAGCSQSFKVAKVFNGTEVTLSDIRYYCATDLSPYLPPVTVALEDIDPTTSSNFPPDLANINCTDACSDPNCWQYNTGRGSETTVNLPRCVWDDSFTLPPTPVLVGSTCQNSVLEVRYNFEWRGAQIIGLTADVVLGDIPNLATTDIEIAQKFSVKWQHSPSVQVPATDNYEDTTEPYQRSGSLGYDFGKPIASGCAEYNVSTGQFDQVDTIQEKQMAVWRPGVDGLCENARREPITFGDDMTSGCALRLTFNDLNNTCDELRQLVTNHLNVLMASDVIGRYGYNDVNNLNMWIPVLRQTLNESTFDPTSSGAAGNVNASFVDLNATEELQSWADKIAGICLLPSGINLNIMYAQTRASDGYPSYEVIGAYVDYTISNWTMDCMGINRRRCDAGSTYTQNFILQSTVTFIKVPPVPSSSQTSFYTQCDPYDFRTDSCYRFFTTFYRDECYYETCLHELAYPVLSVYEGESQKYTLPFFLVLVLGVVGYVSVTRPGWNG